MHESRRGETIHSATTTSIWSSIIHFRTKTKREIARSLMRRCRSSGQVRSDHPIHPIVRHEQVMRLAIEIVSSWMRPMRGFQSLEEVTEAHLKAMKWIRTHLASKERIEKTLSKLPNLTIRLKKTSKSDLQMPLNSNKCIHLEHLPARAPTCWKRNSTKSSSTTGKDWSTRMRRNSRCLLKYFHHLWSPRTKSKLKIMKIKFWSKRRTYRSKEGRARIYLQELSSLKSRKKARPSQLIEARYQASAIQNSLVMASQKWPFCWVQMHDTWRIDRRYKVTTLLMIEMIWVLSQGLIALNEW